MKTTKKKRPTTKKPRAAKKSAPPRTGETLLNDARTALDRPVRDWTTFFSSLEKAAKLGHPEAWEELGAWLLDGFTLAHSVLLPADPVRGFELLTRAEAAGRKGAAGFLARCYGEGLGVKKSLAKELAWTERAVRQGEHSLAVNVACIYRDKEDWRREKTWLTRAAGLGNVDGRLRLLELELVSKREAERTRARRALERLLRAKDPYERDEAREILEHVAATGRRRYV